MNGKANGDRKKVAPVALSWRQTVAMRFLSKNRKLVYLVLLLGTFALGFMVRPIVSEQTAGPTQPPAANPGAVESAAPVAYSGRPGPWGELEYVPITIAAPEELLPVRTMTETPTRWLFKDYSRDDLARMLDRLDVPGELKNQLLNPAALQAQANGLEVTPNVEAVSSLSPSARKGLYQVLTAFPENTSAFVYVQANSIDERFQKGGVSSESAALFRKLSCQHGSYLVFSGMSGILSAMPTYAERLHFLKVLTEQKSILVRLHVNPHSDINALDRYWGKGCWTMDVRAMLESLGALHRDVSLGLGELMPPFPTSLLYTFPRPQNPMNGTPVRRDCHWTAFNFFRDVPDDRYADPNYVHQKLKEDHVPVVGDPRYGDLVLLSRPDGSFVHSAVYLADEVVYTKNGETVSSPWMPSTLNDMVDRYSFLAPPDQKLTVNFFRNKNY
jgi:hypothetical protein